jgi:putative membrane protein insertion efficiency factor
MREIFVLPIRGYQRFLSPALPRSCRYHPSCSQYAVDALRTYGVPRGSVLAVWRIMRCNPFSDGGYDPVERQTLFRSPPAVKTRTEDMETHAS